MHAVRHVLPDSQTLYAVSTAAHSRLAFGRFGEPRCRTRRATTMSHMRVVFRKWRWCGTSGSVQEMLLLTRGRLGGHRSLQGQEEAVLGGKALRTRSVCWKCAGQTSIRHC